jgi:predicted transcriptional regulator
MFYDLRTNEDKIVLALRLILKGMSQRSIAEVLEICPKSVNTWLSRASDQSKAVTETTVTDLEVSRVELDELWTFVGKKESRKTKNTKMREHGSG